MNLHRLLRARGGRAGRHAQGSRQSAAGPVESAKRLSKTPGRMNGTGQRHFPAPAFADAGTLKTQFNIRRDIPRDTDAARRELVSEAAADLQ